MPPIIYKVFIIHTYKFLFIVLLVIIQQKYIFFKKTKQPQLFIKVEVILWQGQKDSNPRHAVLETAALPAELYPCIAVPLEKGGGPSRARTVDRPVMSRLL